MTEVDRLCLRYAQIAGRLAAAVEWSVQHSDECLNDHPEALAQAREALVEALLCATGDTSGAIDRFLAGRRESTARQTATEPGHG